MTSRPILVGCRNALEEVFEIETSYADALERADGIGISFKDLSGHADPTFDLLVLGYRSVAHDDPAVLDQVRSACGMHGVEPARLLVVAYGRSDTEISEEGLRRAGVSCPQHAWVQAFSSLDLTDQIYQRISMQARRMGVRARGIDRESYSGGDVDRVEIEDFLGWSF